MINKIHERWDKGANHHTSPGNIQIKVSETKRYVFLCKEQSAKGKQIVARERLYHARRLQRREN